jgi:hypothetical protein
MESAIAHTIASRSHRGQRTRFGDSVIDHVRRVAAAVPPDAEVTALLHDVLERSPTAARRLWGTGLTGIEVQALELLTHAPGDSYEAYVERIAEAPGPAGQLARIVKLADLNDHLAHPAIPADAPPYAWARKRWPWVGRPTCRPPSLSVGSAAKPDVASALSAINTDLQNIADAQPDLAPDRKQQAQDAGYAS